MISSMMCSMVLLAGFYPPFIVKPGHFFHLGLFGRPSHHQDVLAEPGHFHHIVGDVEEDLVRKFSFDL